MHLVALATPSYWFVECAGVRGYGNTPQSALFELVRYYPSAILDAIGRYNTKPLGATPYASAEVQGHIVTAWVFI